MARELLECEEEANRALDDLCSAIKPGCGGPHPQTPSALESDIPPHLRPRYDAAKELESIMPALIDAAKRAKENPGDEEKAKFIKLLESTQSPLKQISPTDTPEDRALALAKLLDDHVEQMARGARDGKQDTVLCGARFCFLFSFLYSLTLLKINQGGFGCQKSIGPPCQRNC